MDKAGVRCSRARCRQIEGGAQPRSLPAFRREGPSSTRRYVPPSLRELLQQRLRLLEVSGVKALGEPAVDRREQLVGFSMLALLLPQAGQAHGRPQLQRFRLLATG